MFRVNAKLIHKINHELCILYMTCNFAANINNMFGHNAMAINGHIRFRPVIHGIIRIQRRYILRGFAITKVINHILLNGNDNTYRW
jgi:hypothetical protein